MTVLNSEWRAGRITGPTFKSHTFINASDIPVKRSDG